MGDEEGAGGRAFLFTDLVGSTEQWERDPGTMGAALALHDELLIREVAGAGGQVFKHTGDGVAGVFDDPGAAVEGAICAQRGLAAARWPTPFRLTVRMGIHHGLAERRAGDWFGADVNRAARIMGAAHGGQILVSDAVAGAVLPVGVDLVDVGLHRFKGVPEPLRIHHVVADGLVPLDDLPPPSTLPMRHVRVPEPTRPIVGRDASLAATEASLLVSHLVTLTGPAGGGKTRLALEVAHRAVPQRADGVAFVVLDEVPVVLAVADALGFARAPHHPEALARLIADRDLLLVLDGADVQRPQVLAFIEAMPDPRQAHILVTAGLPLRTRGEVEVPVEPLGAEAAALFASVAAEVAPSFDVGASTAEVARICEVLEGNPLAIELAVGRLGAVGLAGLLEDLSVPERLHGAGGAGAPAHHLSLAAALDWTLDRLSDDQRRLVDAARTFDTTFTVEDLAAVTDRPVPAVRDDLATLVSLSVMRHQAGDRHRLGRSIRRHRAEGRRGLAPPDLAGRHAERVLDSISERAPDLRGPGEAAARVVLAPMIAELPRAAHHLVATGRTALVWAALAALAPFESICWFGVAALADELVVADGADAPGLVLAQAASARAVRADLEAARRLARVAVERADPAAGGHPWSVLANTCMTAGDQEEAADAIARGVEVARDTSVFDLAMSASGQSILAFWWGDQDLAGRAGELALESAETSRSDTALSSAAGALGTASIRSDPGLARELLTLSVDLAFEIGNGYHELIARRGLGLLGRIHRDWPTAFGSLVLAMERADQLGEELEYRLAAHLLVGCASKAGFDDVALLVGRTLGPGGSLVSDDRVRIASEQARHALGPAERIRISRDAGHLPRRDLIAWLRGELEERTPAGG